MKAEFAAIRAEMAAKKAGGAAGIGGVTGRSQCDWCRREECPLMTGEGRPCRQYNTGLELWRKKVRADREARDKADTLVSES